MLQNRDDQRATWRAKVIYHALKKEWCDATLYLVFYMKTKTRRPDGLLMHAYMLYYQK